MIRDFNIQQLIKAINSLKKYIITTKIELQSIKPATLKPLFIYKVNLNFKNYFSHIKRIFEIPLDNILNWIPDSFEIYKKEISYDGMITSLNKNISLQNINDNVYKIQFVKNAFATYIYWNLFLESNGYNNKVIPLEEVIREIYETQIYQQKYMKYKNKYIRLLNKSLI